MLFPFTSVPFSGGYNILTTDIFQIDRKKATGSNTPWVFIILIHRCRDLLAYCSL